MLVSIGTLICPNCSNRFSAYGSGFSLTAPVLAFASATDPDTDNTQDLLIDIADPGALAADEIVVVSKLGSDFSTALPSEYTTTDTYTVQAGDVGGGGDYTGEITMTLAVGVQYLRSFHKRGTTYSGPSPSITKTIASPAVNYVKTDNPAVQDLSYGSSTATFTDCAISTAAADRVVVVCVANNARTLTGMTIGGVTAVEAVSSNTGAHTGIWYAEVPTGTTATVVITAGFAFGKIGITVGKLNTATPTPTSTGFLAAGFRANPQLASSATIPANGVGVIAMGDIDTAQGTLTWNNATEDYSTTGTAFGVASGNRTTAGAFQASISGVAFNNISMAVACWGP